MTERQKVTRRALLGGGLLVGAGAAVGGGAVGLLASPSGQASTASQSEAFWGVHQGGTPVNARLAENDALNQFTTHTASAVFAIPPAARQPGDWIGRTLLS
jgi:Dyp-type peroxidase family